MNQQQTLPDANNSSAGRRVRRSEELLRQAAEFVSGGETFQNVSVRFNIPISTIRFYMARKGILPRRKRGRSAAISPQVAQPHQAISATSSQRTSEQAAAAHNQQQYQRQLQENMIIAAGAQMAPKVDHSGGNGDGQQGQQVYRGSRSPSPSGPPFHFANYKLPELRPNLL